MNFNLRKDYKTQQIEQPAAKSPTASILLQPKTVDINGYKFVISKMPCTVAQEVIFKLPTGFLPMLDKFTESQEMAFKMLSYCERVYSDRNVPLISQAVIDNHVPDFQTLLQLEQECLQYNYAFFEKGKLFDFLNKAVCHVESRASGILTDLLDKLLQAGLPPTTN